MASGLFLVDRALFTGKRGYFDGEKYSRREAFLWLVANASYQARTVTMAGRPVNLERGQVTASLRYMADKWGWTVKAVRLFLDRIEADGRITKSAAQACLVVTLTNYDQYQNFAEYGAQQRAQPAPEKGHSEGHGQGHSEGHGETLVLQGVVANQGTGKGTVRGTARGTVTDDLGAQQRAQNKHSIKTQDNNITPLTPHGGGFCSLVCGLSAQGRQGCC